MIFQKRNRVKEDGASCPIFSEIWGLEKQEILRYTMKKENRKEKKDGKI